MIKFEENQNDFLVNKSQILNRVTQYKSQSQSALQVCTKQCSYRYSDSPYPIKVIFQQKAEQKRCSVQFLNYKLEQKQIQQFSEFTKKFYYEQFLQNIYHQNFTSNSSPRESLEAKINSHFFIKQEELQSPIIKIPKANNNFLTNEELLQQVTLYLQQIKQQFLNSISSKIEEINFLNIKEGQKMNLNQEINSIFEKFFCTVRRKKTEQQKEKFINSSLQKRKRRNRGKNNSETKSQSQYHNLKNSLMHFIIQLVSSSLILECFDLTEYQKSTILKIITRLKDNSLNFRPDRGRYHYYSNIHYTTLFLKYNEHNFYEYKHNQKIQEIHSKVYNYNSQLCQSLNDPEFVKFNYFKSIIGQLVFRCLEIVESQFLENFEKKKFQSKKIEWSNRQLYVSKVKKGIQKLLKGKKIIRF